VRSGDREVCAVQIEMEDGKVVEIEVTREVYESLVAEFADIE
jgi:hypothetical protein